MRFILLIISMALIWMLTSTYLDKTIGIGDSKLTSTMDRAGVAEDVSISSPKPSFSRPINKARAVEDQLKQAVIQKEIDTR